MIFGYGSGSGTGVLTGTTDGGAAFDTIAGLTAQFAAPVSQAGAFMSDGAPLGDYTIYAFGAGNVLLESFETGWSRSRRRGAQRTRASPRSAACARRAPPTATRSAPTSSTWPHGALIVPMAGTYPLRDAAKALEWVGASTGGKLALIP